MNETIQANSTPATDSAKNPAPDAALIDLCRQLKPEQVLKFAIDGAHEQASSLYDGLKLLEALGGSETVEVDGDALKWLAAKLKSDADEIMTHADHAQRALGGSVYRNAGKRYREAFEAEAAQ